MRLGAIILAAGSSRRMGKVDKLLLDMNGQPMICQVIQTITILPLDEVVIVTGENHGAITRLMEPFNFKPVFNQHHGDGMGTSLSCGMNAINQDLDGLFVCLGDMPSIRPETFHALARAMKDLDCQDILALVPEYGGRCGHPVLFSSKVFPSLAGLSGDEGARHILKELAGRIRHISVPDPGIHDDVDTRTDYIKVKNGIRLHNKP